MVTNYSLVIGQRLDGGAETSCVVLTEDRSYSDDHPPLTPLSLLVTDLLEICLLDCCYYLFFSLFFINH